jgi:hypothetical protein
MQAPRQRPALATSAHTTQSLRLTPIAAPHEQHGACHGARPRNFGHLQPSSLPWRSGLAHPGTARSRALSRHDPCVSPGSMAGAPTASRPMPPKLRRVLELVYAVEGVVAARVWHWPGRIAVGVRGGSATSPMDLLRRVEIAVASLREAEESWDFGILEDESPRSPPPDEASEPEGSVSSPRRLPRSPS